MRRFVLSISTFIGFSPGASHYTGEILAPAEDRNGKLLSVRLERTLDTKGATNLNKADGTGMGPRHRWKAGEKTERFEDRKSVIAAAQILFREKFAQTGNILFVGAYASGDPMEVLEGPAEFKQKAAALFKRAEAIDFWENDEKEMRAIAKEWDALMKTA